MEGEVKSMRRLLMALCGLVLVSGCAATEGKLPLASGEYRLYEAASTKSGQLVAVINSRSQTTERRLPGGTLSPDGKRLYAVTSNKLQEIDSHTGAVLRTLPIPSFFDAPPAGLGGVPGGLSQNGRWLALQTGGEQRWSAHLCHRVHKCHRRLLPRSRLRSWRGSAGTVHRRRQRRPERTHDRSPHLRRVLAGRSVAVQRVRTRKAERLRACPQPHAAFRVLP